jgi:RNA polymerase sigma-70 factor (ECF subfamily)
VEPGANPRRQVAASAGVGLGASWSVHDPSPIAAVHADAASAAATNWNQIVELYDALLRIQPSPIVALNQGLAVAMRRPRSGVDPIDDILANGDLADYHLAHAARADLCRRL